MITKRAEQLKQRLKMLPVVMTAAAKEMESKAKGNAPNYWKDRTSHARQGIHSGIDSQGSERFLLWLSHSVKYGMALERGSQGREILPRNKKAITWEKADHPVKRARHPGTKPRPLLRDTIKENRQVIAKQVKRYLTS